MIRAGDRNLEPQDHRTDDEPGNRREDDGQDPLRDMPAGEVPALATPLEWSASSPEVVDAIRQGQADAGRTPATALVETSPPAEPGQPATAAPPAAGPANLVAQLRAEQERRRKRRAAIAARVREETVAWLKTVASAAVYATLIVTFGFQVARVEGQSMAPTLEDQDRLIVNKLIYRLTSPESGDIVMLYYPVKPDRSFVKRIIGEEGDTVKVEDGQVFVNDIPLADQYVPSEYRSHDNWGPQVVPPGYYFVMGDHRNNSSDSRQWGFVPKRYIIGKVQVRWWPLPEARLF